ncbi:DNA-binding protein [Equine adenovirus 1]|uniref:DNA-binding protein n=1 Tax=Equine adenovirus A serotype 1 TaxID=46916 RepID=A0A1B0XBB3_ADEE1|nr:DNA-binding protein [Equine adenovirus 1]
MSQKYRLLSDPSSEEDVPAPEVPPKKRSRKRAAEAPRATGTAVATGAGELELSQDDSVSYVPPSKLLKSARKRGAAAVVAREEEEEEEEDEEAVREVCGSVKLPLTSKKPDHQWQLAMEMALKILTPLKVDHSALTLLPDPGTLECFRKAGQAFMTAHRICPAFTFTSPKSFQHLLGRMLLDFVIKASDIGTRACNVSGCVIWNHHCQTRLHCLHGTPMIQKEQLVEMDVNSENAQRALKETPEKAKIVANRWGRNVVQLVNEDAMCCSYDVALSGNNFSGNSCGMFYTDGRKALMAFSQLMAFQRASYPKMKTAESHMLMPLRCECNWNSDLPLLGRQTCKITPFSLQTAAGVDKGAVEDAKLLATLNHPAILVFQCCNPVYRNSKANPQKNCDLKISAVDVMACLQIAKQIWQASVGSPPPLRFPEFKWAPEYCYQNTILPQGQVDKDDSLF